MELPFSRHVQHGSTGLLSLDSIPAVLGTRDKEAEQPQNEQHCSNDPQHVEGEPSSGEDQHQQQHQQYHSHVIVPLHTASLNSFRYRQDH